MSTQLHVFLSYNRRDNSIVSKIAEALQSRGIIIWFDEWELRPGLPWQELVEEAIQKSYATIVFIGPDGLGKWETPEMRAALELQVYNNNPVIPVILPQAPDKVESTLPIFLRRNTWVDFRRGSADEQAWKRLLFGITGKHPDREIKQAEEKIAPPEPDARTQIDEVVINLIQYLKSGNATYFLGPGAYYDSSSLRPCDIAQQLFTELNLIDVGYDKLLPPVDIAGMYYGVKSGDWNLESRVIELIMERSEVAPPVYELLAESLKVLARRPRRRVPSKRQQLIVSTSPDIFMERALLKAGISFTRIVQHKSARQLQINEYSNVNLAVDEGVIRVGSGSNLQECAISNNVELDDLIATCGTSLITEKPSEANSKAGNALHALSLKDFTEPILYKLLGSQDVENSCAISTTQHLEFMQRALWFNCIPAQISEIIANTPVVFLGHGFLDPDFRLTYHILLKDPFELELKNDIRLAVQLPPKFYPMDIYRKMESGLWEQLKKTVLKQFGIVTIERRGEDFLQMLLDKLK